MKAAELLKQRMDKDKQHMERSFKAEWDATNRRFGPATNNSRIEEARKRALDTLHTTYRMRADKLLQSYGEREQEFAEVDQMAQQGMTSVDPEEMKLRMILGPVAEEGVFPKQASFEQLDVRRGKIRSELERFELGRMDERGAFLTEPETRDTAKGLRWPWPFQGKHRVPTTAGGVYVKETAYDEAKKKETERHRPATQEEMRYYAELQQADKEAMRLQTAALRSARMLNAGQGTFAQKAVGNREKKKLTSLIAAHYLQTYGNRAAAMAAAEKDGYTE